MKAIRIHPDDNVAVILEDIRQGEALELNGITVTAADGVWSVIDSPFSDG